MKQGCYSSGDLPAILRLPPEAAERVHLETCPRCRALLLSYEEFMLDSSLPEGANLQDAEAKLHAALRESMARASGRPARSSSTMPAGWIRIFTRTIGRPSVLIPAGATILVAVGLFSGVLDLPSRTGPDRLRGSSTSNGAETPVAIRPLEPQVYAEDGIELRWRAAPEASSYQIVVFGADLHDLAHYGPFADTTVVIRRTDLHPQPEPKTVIGWQVFGLRDGSTVAISPVAAARLP